MLVLRWQAPIVPNAKQIKLMFVAEGLTPYLESFQPNTELTDHRHPFDEVRMIVEGELIVDVNGNKLLLRAGDKITIPSNTKHSKKVDSTGQCISICAKRTF